MSCIRLAERVRGLDYVKKQVFNSEERMVRFYKDTAAVQWPEDLDAFVNSDFNLSEIVARFREAVSHFDDHTHQTIENHLAQGPSRGLMQPTVEGQSYASGSGEVFDAQQGGSGQREATPVTWLDNFEVPSGGQEESVDIQETKEEKKAEDSSTPSKGLGEDPVDFSDLVSRAWAS